MTVTIVVSCVLILISHGWGYRRGLSRRPTRTGNEAIARKLGQWHRYITGVTISYNGQAPFGGRDLVSQLSSTLWKAREALTVEPEGGGE